MKRKMVSFILCIAMCMALAIPAFAVELSPYATDEVGNFSQMIEFAFSDNVEGRFRYSYNDAAGNVVDGIVIKEISTDGTTKLNFVEGDKSDKVEIDSIRDVILNGNCIKVTTQESSKLSTEYDIAPFAHTVKYLDGPPDGTVATDYSKLIGTQKKDITFMQDLLDMTSGAFVTVVIAALGFNPLGAFAAGVLLGKICHIGGTVHPDGIHAISVRVLSYQRPSGPGVIGYGTVDRHRRTHLVRQELCHLPAVCLVDKAVFLLDQTNFVPLRLGVLAA